MDRSRLCGDRATDEAIEVVQRALAGVDAGGTDPELGASLAT